MTEGTYKYGYGVVILALAIALLAAMTITDGTTNSANTNNPDPTGQGSGSNSPAAVEIETPDTTKTITPVKPEVKLVSVSGTTVRLEVTNSHHCPYQCIGAGVCLKNFNRQAIPTETFIVEPGERVFKERDIRGSLPYEIKEIQVTSTWIEGSYFVRDDRYMDR